MPRSRLIAERGIKGTTLGDVGEAAGYSSGLTAHHYKTKEGLLKAVTAEIHRRFQQTLSEATLPPAGLARLLAAVDVYLSVNDVRAARALSLIQKEALTQQSEFRGILLQVQPVIGGWYCRPDQSWHRAGRNPPVTSIFWRRRHLRWPPCVAPERSGYRTPTKSILLELPES